MYMAGTHPNHRPWEPQCLVVERHRCWSSTTMHRRRWRRASSTTTPQRRRIGELAIREAVEAIVVDGFVVMMAMVVASMLLPPSSAKRRQLLKNAKKTRRKRNRMRNMRKAVAAAGDLHSHNNSRENLEDVVCRRWGRCRSPFCVAKSTCWRKISLELNKLILTSDL